MTEVQVETIVHLDWEGAFTLEVALTRVDRKTDYGVYQVYGPHPVYGLDALLYIGKVEKQTFGARLAQENWQGWQSTNGRVSVHLGRLHGSTTPTNLEWNQLIARTERLLICAHRPSHNARGIYRGNAADHYLHILNWGNRGALLPEVSGSRWMGRYARIEGYAPFGSHTNALNTPLDAESTEQPT